MKKRLIGAALVGAALLVLPPKFLGFSIFHLGHAVQVSTSLSAKLACSAKYLTGLDDEQIVSDLMSYSPVANLVKLEYINAPTAVKASLFGMAQVTAQYRPGIGCALTYDGIETLNDTNVSPLPAPSSAPWPEGEQVKYVDLEVQAAVNNILRSDDQAGLNTRAIVVVKDGEIVAEGYADGISNKTPLLGWSMAKSVTAMMLGRLEALGKVSDADKQLFSQWQDERQKLTLKQLLQMSSGLQFDETYAPGSDATHMLFTASSASDVAINSALAHAPDSQFSYSSGTTNLLSRYLHQVLGENVNQTVSFLQQELFIPAGIHSAVFEPDASGVLVGSSYLYATGRDWARLGLIMVNGGKINNEHILAADWIKRATSANSSDNEKAYGYQFWLNQGDDNLRWPALPEDAYAMMGNRHQSVMMIPSQSTVLVRLGWTKGDYPMEQNYAQLLEALKEKPILPAKASSH